MSEVKKYYCTKDHPWKPEYGPCVEHPNVIVLGENPGYDQYGDIITLQCLDCEHIWEAEC